MSHDVEKSLSKAKPFVQKYLEAVLITPLRVLYFLIFFEVILLKDAAGKDWILIFTFARLLSIVFGLSFCLLGWD